MTTIIKYTLGGIVGGACSPLLMYTLMNGGIQQPILVNTTIVVVGLFAFAPLAVIGGVGGFIVGTTETLGIIKN